MNTLLQQRQQQQSAVADVLFLRGVFPVEKKVEDMMRDKLLNNVPTIDIKTYDKIPVHFTTLEDWPKHTNLRCWYCSRTFKTIPWFEPVSIEPYHVGQVGKFLNSAEVKTTTQKRSIIITTHGNFCSCNCTMAYIITNTKLSERANKVDMLKMLYEIFMGKSIPDIQPSPLYTEQLAYGGEMSNVTYQQKIDSLDSSYVKELECNNYDAICSEYMKVIN